MNRWLIALVALLAIGGCMRTNQSQRRMAIMRKVADRVEGFDRFVDIGVKLTVVRASPSGEIALPNGLRVAAVRWHRWGGVVDTKAAHPYICGPSRAPREWLCSEDQEEIILHPDAAPRGSLVVGSEGSGKTTALAMWHHRRWVENLGEFREGGQTAPTLNRLGLVRHEIDKLWRANWCRYVSRDDFEGYELCDGSRIRFRHTHQQSSAQGSPVQGFNWSWAGRDEMQDQVDVHEDIEARGRAAKHGGLYYKQLGTATAKDNPDWRTLRDMLEAGADASGKKLWLRRMLYGRHSPFIAPEYWDGLKSKMSAREYDRRVNAKDVGPELATYPDWSRETNLIAVPDLGWTDVTAVELRGSGANYQLLVGHDPGTLVDVSLFIKAYVPNSKQAAYGRGLFKPWWVVVGELNTEQSTTEVHIKRLLETVRERWMLNLLTPMGRANPNGEQMLVRADPAGTTDNRTDKSVYTQFANAGIRIKPAAYNSENDGHGKVPKDPGIEVVNTLICDAAGLRRLYVARLADGSPAAPKLVAALEASERDMAGKAETQRKGPADVSHWPAALRYALWAIERPRLKLLPKEES